MTPGQRNLVFGLWLGIAVLLVVFYFTSLLSSEPGEVAQALGNLLGAAFGTLGAFGVAYWTFKRSDLDKLETRARANDLLHSDLRVVGSIIKFTIATAQYVDHEEQIEPGFFVGLVPAPLDRLEDPRFPLHLFDAEEVRDLEYLALVISVYRSRLLKFEQVEASERSNALRPIWTQLDHLRVQTAHKMRMLSPNKSTIFAAQLEAFKVHDWVPSRNPNSHPDPDGFMKLLNDVNRARPEESNAR